MPDKFLRIYMQDQLALGTGWRELARRAARSNRGTEAGAALQHVADQIAQDVATFEQIMRRLGIRPDPIKRGVAIAAERAGRLKPNGHLRSYSPLSRFMEMDILAMGIEGKKVLWQNLRDTAQISARLPDVDFDELIARAERQREELEPHRLAAGAGALG